MVVIPTNNGYFHLQRFIKSMETYGTNGHKVCVVDTGSTDVVSKAYLKELETYTGPIQLVVTSAIDGYGYESGAAISAIRQYPLEDKFLFTHDSCEATSSHWLEQFEEKLTPSNGAVAWLKFQPCMFCVFPSHAEYMQNIIDMNNVPDSGIFGGIFYTYGDIMRKMDADGKFDYPPCSKIHSEAWERLWALLLHQYGYEFDHIVPTFNPMPIHQGAFPHFRKYFGGRQ